jgi:hypothetical protein
VLKPCVFILALAGLSAAQAQVAFESVARGEFSSLGGSERRVVRSAAELGPAAQVLPAGATIDWTTHSLLFAAMGQQSGAGHSIAIVRVERQLLHSTPQAVTRWRIEVREERPSGPAAAVITAPYHLVRVPRIAAGDQVEWAVAAPVAAPFTRLSWNLGGGHGLITRAIAVEASGALVVSRRSGFGSGTAEVKTAQLGAEELARLSEAVVAADFATIPGELPAPIPPPMDAPWGRFELVQGGATRTVRVPVAFTFGAFQARLEPLVDLLEELADRESPLAFAQVALSSSEQVLGQPLARRITVGADGRVAVRRTHPTGSFPPLDGAATPEELEALSDAVQAARLASVPSPLPVPVIMIHPARPFRLEVHGQDPALAASVSGQLDAYGPWEGRLRPLVAALEAIADRLGGVPTNREVSGEVTLAAGRVFLREPSGAEWRVNDAEAASLLRRFPGRTARARGRAEGSELREVSVLSPTAAAGHVVPIAAGGRIAVTPPASTFGPAALALRRAAGRVARLDGWLFSSSGQLAEVYVSSVDATARQAGTLRRNGIVTGHLVPGQVVTITRAASGFAWVRTAGGDAGYFPLSRLEVGEQPTVHAAPAPTSPGVTGALEDDGH